MEKGRERRKKRERGEGRRGGRKEGEEYRRGGGGGGVVEPRKEGRKEVRKVLNIQFLVEFRVVCGHVVPNFIWDLQRIENENNYNE
jgi:hypothetical protein